MIPLSSLLSSPNSFFSLPFLCHFSCLPFPASPRSHPPSSATQFHRLSCRHPRPAHIPALVISPTPPLHLLYSLSGQSVTTLLLSPYSCGPSPIIDHFDCDTDHFCLTPFLHLSHPEGKPSHYVQRLKKKKKKILQRRGRVERKDGWRSSRNKGIWMDRERETRIINERWRVGEAKKGTEAWMNLGERGWTQQERAKRGERRMQWRGVKKGWKWHNLFYPPVRKECEMKEGERRRREREWEGQTEEGEQGLRRATGEQGITARHGREEVMIKKGKCDAFLTCLHPVSLMSSFLFLLVLLLTISFFYLHPSIHSTACVRLHLSRSAESQLLMDHQIRYGSYSAVYILILKWNCNIKQDKYTSVPLLQFKVEPAANFLHCLRYFSKIHSLLLQVGLLPKERTSSSAGCKCSCLSNP